MSDEPETYADAVAAPAAKQRRFTHRGLAGDVAAVEVNGTTFYNTTPPEYAVYDIAPYTPHHITPPVYESPHRTWRPLVRQALYVPPLPPLILYFLYITLVQRLPAVLCKRFFPAKSACHC